jgi:hypothetical protein
VVSILKHWLDLRSSTHAQQYLCNSQEIQKMKKSKLIDMFGLSGDSASNDRLDDLLFCLESDTSTASKEILDDSAALSFSVTINTCGYESEDVFFKL